jgi:uncharacterized protein (DUF2062 family)
MRKRLRRWLPDHQTLSSYRCLAPFTHTLPQARLWQLNRRSVAGAVAAGLFCGLIPGPFQMLAAAICALAFRVNLPLAVVMTLYTNPLTVVPLYIVAYTVGTWAIGGVGHPFIAPPDYGNGGFVLWLQHLTAWMIGLGKPLLIGLVLLASVFAVTGYLAVRLSWRIYLVRVWRRRRHHRQVQEP